MIASIEATARTDEATDASVDDQSMHPLTRLCREMRWGICDPDGTLLLSNDNNEVDRT
jgi:hypothetical protein